MAATTTDDSDDNESAVQQVNLGDRYCSDCEIQFKSFKTFKVRMMRPGTRPHDDRRVLLAHFVLCFPETPFRDLVVLLITHLYTY